MEPGSSKSNPVHVNGNPPLSLDGGHSEGNPPAESSRITHFALSNCKLRSYTMRRDPWGLSCRGDIFCSQCGPTALLIDCIVMSCEQSSIAAVTYPPTRRSTAYGVGQGTGCATQGGTPLREMGTS